MMRFIRREDSRRVSGRKLVMALCGLAWLFAISSVVPHAPADDAPPQKRAAAAVTPATDSSKAKSPKPGAGPDPKRFQPFGYIVHEHEVTVSGRALNDDGEPVAGARVFVVPVVPRRVGYGKPLAVLAEGKTDADGRYRFEHVKLPVLEFAPQAVPRPTEGLFQVFAIAEGYGFVWRRTHGYRPEQRPAVADGEEPPKELRHVFFADEPIVLDLALSPEVRLHGTVSDDLGHPVENAVVQAGLVNSDRDPPGAPPRMWNCSYIEGSIRGEDEQFEAFFALPEEFRLARTDADGYYEIRGLPRDSLLLAYIDYRLEYDAWSATVSTGNAPQPQVHLAGYAGNLDHVFVMPLTLRVTVRGRNRQPLENVVVRQESERRVRRAGALDRTDALGSATLKLRPGKSTLIVEPTIGQPYLPAKLAVEFPDDPREDSIELELEPAAEVVFEAVEKETGKPVTGVAFLSEPAEARERKPVESQLSFVDHPHTGGDGRMQAYFEPGERRFFVDRRRSPYAFEPVAPTTDLIDLSSGKPAHVRFEFTRRPMAAPAEPAGGPEPIAEELKPLAELLRKQRERFECSQRARFHLRRHDFLTGPLSHKEMTRLLDSLATKTPDECLASIRAAFPDFGGLIAQEITTDGLRRRVEAHYPERGFTEVSVVNGEETIVGMGGGTQIDIFGLDNATIGFLAPRDFWRGPAAPTCSVPKTRLQAVGRGRAVTSMVLMRSSLYRSRGRCARLSMSRRVLSGNP